MAPTLTRGALEQGLLSSFLGIECLGDPEFNYWSSPVYCWGPTFCSIITVESPALWNRYEKVVSSTQTPFSMLEAARLGKKAQLSPQGVYSLGGELKNRKRKNQTQQVGNNWVLTSWQRFKWREPPGYIFPGIGEVNKHQQLWISEWRVGLWSILLCARHCVHEIQM